MEGGRGVKYFSTFTGIGGFELGIHNAYDNAVRAQDERDTNPASDLPNNISNLPQERGQRPVCVGYSEIDKYAVQVYDKHFNGVRNYGDITKINADELPDFDCLVGGFPCQAFSIAGKRGGFEDTRGTLFFDLARILRAKRPKLFVFENVKGLLSHDDGKTFRTIISAIDELGYDAQWQIINSKNHGVPQNRERVIIVGHLRGEPRPQVFPILGTSSQASLAQVNEQGRSVAERIYDPAGLAMTLSANGSGGGGKTGLYQISKTVRAGGRKSPHGSKQNWDSYEVEGVIRRLTPLECERLQGFPDDWTKVGTTPCVAPDCWKCTLVPADSEHMVETQISDTQRYKLCGNAVTTNVIQAVFERIFA